MNINDIEIEDDPFADEPLTASQLTPPRVFQICGPELFNALFTSDEERDEHDAARCPEYHDWGKY